MLSFFGSAASSVPLPETGDDTWRSVDSGERGLWDRRRPFAGCIDRRFPSSAPEEIGRRIIVKLIMRSMQSTISSRLINLNQALKS